MGVRFRRAKIRIDVIDHLKAGETVMDTDEPGFGVRRQGDARVFFLRKHANGRRHYVTIGEFGSGSLTITTARDKAKKLVVAIREGASPSEQRARNLIMPTVRELASDWLQHHVDPKLKSSTARNYRSTLKSTILPNIGSFRVDHLTEENVARMHHVARKTPYVANRALAIVSKLMGFAERKGLRPRGSNPVKGLERYREDKRERYLSQSELGRLGRALASAESVARHSSFALAAIALLLLTGMRLNEVLKLRWDEVDLERGLLFLRDSKSGKKQIILGAEAMRLLIEIPRTTGAWVFPGGKPNQPLYDVKKTWAFVLRSAQLDGVRLHDLRHTFASVTAAAGGSLPMIGRLLGHSQPATTARYSHLAIDTVRELADRSSKTIAAALGPLILSPRIKVDRHD